MKHYKAPNGEVCAFEADGSQDYLITDDLAPITEAECDAFLTIASDIETVSRNMRGIRDILIAATDKMLLPDYDITATGLEAIKIYRQALRDITKQTGFPCEIEWPVKPQLTQ